MASVWKIGTRWGNQGESNFAVCVKYGCVFFGECFSGHLGDWSAVKSGDLFIICDGETPIALGKANGGFEKYKDFPIRFNAEDETHWIDENVRLCQVILCILPKSEQKWSRWSNAVQSRFCRYNGPKDVELCFNDLMKKRRAVWKFGCRWDDDGIAEASIFQSVFKKYGIAFAYTHAVLDVSEGDLVAIADGETIVAIGEIASPPTAELSKIHCNHQISKEDREAYFTQQNVCGVKVRYHELSPEFQFSYAKRGRFSCAGDDLCQKVNLFFEKQENLETP